MWADCLHRRCKWEQVAAHMHQIPILASNMCADTTRRPGALFGERDSMQRFLNFHAWCGDCPVCQWLNTNGLVPSWPWLSRANARGQVESCGWRRSAGVLPVSSPHSFPEDAAWQRATEALRVPLFLGATREARVQEHSSGYSLPGHFILPATVELHLQRKTGDDAPLALWAIAVVICQFMFY